MIIVIAVFLYPHWLELGLEFEYIIVMLKLGILEPST